MNDMISKSKVLKWLEIQIAECSRELKAQSKQKWISCDDRLPETDDYYLVYGIEYEFCSPPLYLSDEEIPYYGILQYSLKHKAWNTKAPINVTHWQLLPEPPKGE